MCTIYENKVKWVISKDFVMKIKKSLETDSDEIAGALLFEDSCKGNVCNKKSTEFKINNGNGSSVLNPHGIINFHTHPRSAYNGQDAVYGWPSGEDMAQTIVFAKKNNLIHIVFTLEGAYIIHVKKTMICFIKLLMEQRIVYTKECTHHLDRNHDDGRSRWADSTVSRTFSNTAKCNFQLL